MRVRAVGSRPRSARPPSWQFGELGVWNYSGSGDTSVLAAHEYMINGLAFDRAAGNALFTASLDGTLRHVDLETSCVHTLLDANPGGWVTRAAWRMMMAVESSADWGFVLVGDDVGRAHMVDPRAPGVARVARLHRKDKITCLAANPCMSNLLLSTSNDHTMRLCVGRAAYSQCCLSRRHCPPRRSRQLGRA